MDPRPRCGQRARHTGLTRGIPAGRVDHIVARRHRMPRIRRREFRGKGL
ncbi:hypothetical protein RSPO_c02931 [Ralstonia solanacearum Po82]|uniref:Uncharacterized protein n=1 Tax=Ralstonia solanacearum (strain Po82) TaxID=1031711 RepID=F6G5C2_RALS8|nr:hypothetical protein RSPO_c02931 [Ralstonia solanacearum Po82]